MILRGKTLHADQRAYRAGMSTETALQRVTQLIKALLDSGGFAVSTYMDIEGAFNHTLKGIISDALRRFGVSTLLVDWTSHMLRNRELEVTKGKTTVRRCDVSSGCLQWGVMSPLLLCLIVDNLLTNLSVEGYQVVGYADDIMIIRRGPFLHTLIELKQGDSWIVEAWCRSTGLGVNRDKTEVMVFTRKYKWDKTY